MTTLRKLVRAQISALADDEVEVVMSTAALARDGHILVPQGCRLDNYRANPIVLWGHDPDKPVGNAENVQVAADSITARVKFAPMGISPKADEIRGLTKAGVIRAVSIGFDVFEGDPLDPKKPFGGQRWTDWELLELSFVSVPADTGALVTARAQGGERSMPEWKVGAAKGLPIEDSDDWDGAAAQKSIFEWAGGDEFDPAKARTGFLVYDAGAPDRRGSYKLPIAHVVDGELKVPKGAIRAAASRLPDTDIPDDVKKDAAEVLDAYKKKAGIGEGDGRGHAPKTRRLNRVHGLRDGRVTFTRGVYQVAQLCYVFEQLGYQVDFAKYESAIEGDASKVPSMLAAVMHDLGDALLAMAGEEIAEALAGCDVELEDVDADADSVLVIEERAYIAAAPSPAARAFRRGLAHAKLRAGKTLSTETVRCLREARDCHEAALALYRSAMTKHREGMAAVDDLMDRAGVEDEDTTEVQTSDDIDDVDDDDGVDDVDDRDGSDYRRRQAELLALRPH